VPGVFSDHDGILIWENSEVDRSGQVSGGHQGDHEITQEVTARAGGLVRRMEQALLPMDPPPFSSRVGFEVGVSGAIRPFAVAGPRDGCTWPSVFIYELDAKKGQYVQTQVLRQSADPFVCFMPWPY
jgi:hypothetical protein